jgi:hypothetical protein
MIKPHPQIDRYEKNGVYQVKCIDCSLKHIGQTGQTFYTGSKEHIQAVSNNNDNSGYSSHILNTGHAYGSIADTVKIIKNREKVKTSKYSRKMPIHIKLVKTDYT